MHQPLPDVTPQGSVVLWAPPEHRALAEVLGRQARSRGLHVEHHSPQIDEPSVIMEALRARSLPARLVIFAAGASHIGTALHTPAVAWQQAWAQQCLAGLRVGMAAGSAWRAQDQGTLIYLGDDLGVTDAQAVRHTPSTDFSASGAVASAGLRSLSQSMARAWGPRQVHVAHVRLHHSPPWSAAQAAAVAQACWMLHDQAATAWTHELDLRPTGALAHHNGVFVQ